MPTAAWFSCASSWTATRSATSSSPRIPNWPRTLRGPSWLRLSFYVSCYVSFYVSFKVSFYVSCYVSLHVPLHASVCAMICVCDHLRHGADNGRTRALAQRGAPDAQKHQALQHPPQLPRRGQDLRPRAGLPVLGGLLRMNRSLFDTDSSRSLWFASGKETHKETYKDL